MSDLAVAAANRFDLTGPLPGAGVTLLEASAGTGKTFTIAALVTRFVAEGIPIERILAVTFTRMATAELRGRVRDRIVASEETLRGSVDEGGPVPGADPVDVLLASGPRATVADRLSFLGEAIANFDAATITTTHGFCHLVLASLGVSGGVGFGSVLTEDPGDVLDEVVDDLYTRWCLRNGKPFTLDAARSAARAALANPGTELAAGGTDGSTSDLLRRLAVVARTEVSRRLTEAGLLTYDDVLSRLSEALRPDGSEPERGESACRLLRERYDVVLVDEFQDTDPTQWSIVKNAFGTGDTALVLIGDPKQAIYSFRGGDVHSYLEAARLATQRFTLSENWRSDAGLVKAQDSLLTGAQLGHQEILYRPVSVPDSHREPGLAGSPNPTPLRIRIVRGSDDPDLVTNNFGIGKPSAEQWIARDVAADVSALLGSDARLTRGDQNRAVGAGDIAVLVRTNRQAQVIQNALRVQGVAAVAAGADSVFTSESAKHWLRLLEALEQPASRSRAAAAALTPFIGMVPERIAMATETEWEELHARLHSWAEALRRRGMAAMFRWVVADGRVPARLLEELGGARTLTDMGHIAQLLHSESSANSLGPTALRAWLSRRIEEAKRESDIEERTRRLETDANAVQVLTIHRAKGLEFPVVYCPFLWDSARGPDQGAPVIYHDPERGFARMLDVGTAEGDRAFGQHRELEVKERRAEDLRLLYVALTRAQHQLILWWARVRSSEQSPLYRVLAGRRSDGTFDPSPRRLGDAEIERRFDALSAGAPGSIAVERCGRLPAPGSAPSFGEQDGRRSSDPSSMSAMATASFDRALDLAWRRSSYSSIVAGDHSSGDLVASEPEDTGTFDEQNVRTETELAAGSVSSLERLLREHPLPLGAVPSSAAVGTFVHHVLEAVDFSDPELPTLTREAIRSEWERRPPELTDPDALVDGLVAAIRTPLGPLAADVTLGDIERGDRLDEVGFELPLAGGDAPSGRVLTSEIAGLFATHLDPAGPLLGYPGRLASPQLGTDLRGYLTGSLDLVFRVRTEGGAHRYFVADYKTNRLGGINEEVSAWNYRPEALDNAMQHAHYPLQAILYAVALHRYLRWRLPGYDPDTNLGGVLYLFVRGMTGPQCPIVDGQPCGVFSWKAPTSLIESLSDLFDTPGRTGIL